MKESYLYRKLFQNKVQCRTCAHFCLLAPKERGKCGVRENIDGKLYTLNYGKLIAIHIDPIEKKPFYHFLPASQSLSIATVGCNFSCKNCFLPATFVITQQGPIVIEEIFNSGKDFMERKDGSIIAKVNPYRTITHQGKWRKIIHAFRHPFNGEIFRIKPYYTPEILCTPSHEMFVVKNPSEKPKKVRARELTKDYYLVIPKNYSFPKREPILDLKAILSAELGKKYKKKRKLTEKDVKKILELSEKGFTSRQIGKMFGLHPNYVRTLRSKLRKRGNFSTLKDIVLKEKENQIKFTNERGYIPRFIKLDKNLARLLGYYCAEGCVSKGKNRPNSYALVFSFSKDEKEKIEKTKELLKKIFGINTSIEKQRTDLTIRTSKTSVALFFKILCGENAKNKKVPFVLNESPKEIIHEFLKTYVECDGWVEENDVIAIDTVSKKLALGIYWLWLKMGFPPSFYEWHSPSKTKIENRIVNQSTLYYVKLKAQKFRYQFLFPNKKFKISTKSLKSVKFLENDKFWFVPIFDISKEKYSGWVYNLEVEKEHSYLANFVAVGNCQNWEISQVYKGKKEIPGEYILPEKIIEIAKENNLPSISYTYVEPTIFLEYALDVMKLAKKAGLKNNFVSNGFMSEESAKLVIPYLDAINIDIKGFTEDFYQKICRGKLEPVLKTAKLMKKKKVWVEITTLVIPTLNDDEKTFEGIAKWIFENLGPETPWHISQFCGAISWKLKHLPDTPLETLEKAIEIGKKVGLKYVYIGNIPGHKAENTFCPKCGALAINRANYFVHRYDKEGKCPKCGENLDLILKDNQ